MGILWAHTDAIGCTVLSLCIKGCVASLARGSQRYQGQRPS